MSNYEYDRTYLLARLYEARVARNAPKMVALRRQLAFLRRAHDPAVLNTDFDALYDQVERLCITETNPQDGTTTLADWMREGDWQNSTAERIALEWDQLNYE